METPQKITSILFKRILTTSIAYLLIISSAFAQGVWQQMMDFPGVNRSEAISFSYGNRGFICGGMKRLSPPFGPLKDFYSYDQVTDTWQRLSDMPNSLSEGVSFMIGTKIYLLTGEDSLSFTDNIMIWDTVAQYWSTSGPIPQEVKRIRGIGFSIQGKGYVTCGIATDQSQILSDLWEYDPQTNLWTRKADIPGPARYDAACFTINNKAYISSGFTHYANSLKDLWEYDPSTDLWSQKASFPDTLRHGAVGFAIGNMGYLSWGAAGENESPLCRNMLQYNPGEDKWAVLEVFPSIPSIYARGFVINNTGFFTTGINLYNPLFTWSFTPGTVGIKVDNRTHSSIYPNPVNNELHLSFQDEYIGDVFVCLIDVYGKTISMQRFVKVEKSFQTSMDLSSLSPGFYSVIIKDKSGNFLSKEKVVKQ